jgi:DNA-binding MarR family transcriptional regulator
MNERGDPPGPAAGTPGSVAFTVIAALNAVESRFEAALEPLGLSLAKLGALSRLVAAGEPLPLGTLAERCACVRSNITQLVDRLEADGLVARADDARDRRSIRAGLTAEGRRRQAAGLRALEEAEKELLSRLPRAQRGLFLQLLEGLRADR